MQIDLPDVVAEIRAAFDRYEKALVSNDVATLDQMFRNDPRTIRYGQAENLYGYKEIEAFRAAQPSAGLAGTLSKTVIMTFGRDCAMASTGRVIGIHLAERLLDIALSSLRPTPSTQ
jgi:hypothetical protein